MQKSSLTCDDCNSTGFYHPLMGPREPCRTCSFVSKQELAKRAVALEKTAPPGDVLVGPADAAQRGSSTVERNADARRRENEEWMRRHPVVGTPPSGHAPDCLCNACHDEYMKVPREERIRLSWGEVIETKYEVRGFKTWKITIYANGNRTEEEQDFLKEEKTTRFVHGGSIWRRVVFSDGSSQEVDTGIVATPESLRLRQMLDVTCDHSAACVRWCEICNPTVVAPPCQHLTEWVRVWSTIGVIVRWCEICGAVQQNDKPWEHPER